MCTYDYNKLKLPTQSFGFNIINGWCNNYFKLL